jgi:hypothetical protein
MLAKYGLRLGAHNSLLWVPLAPPSYALLCMWVLASLGSTGSQGIGLRRLKYAHHSA